MSHMDIDLENACSPSVAVIIVTQMHRTGRFPHHTTHVLHHTIASPMSAYRRLLIEIVQRRVWRSIPRSSQRP